MKDNKTAIIYLRVSTEEQVDNFSLDTQERICKQEAERRGLTINQIFREEGRSAKTITGRPVLIEALEFCRKNKRSVGAFIVYRLDRLSRQTSDYLAIRRKLAEYEISLISASEPTGNSPTEKFVETMLASFAQMDNDVRSERTKNGLRARFLAGLISGTAPLGYKNENGYTIKDPKTWDLVKKSWELMATGSKTLKEMTNLLNDWGVRQRYAGKEKLVMPQALSRMYRNKFYIGILTSEKYPEEIRGQHIPMVSESIFYRVQAAIDGRNTNINVPIVRRNVDNKDFPLRKILICGNCQKTVTGGWSKGKRARYAYYRCQKGCGGPSISTEKVQKETIVYLSNISPTKDGLNGFIALLRKSYFQRIKQLQKRKEVADLELTKLYELRQALIQKNLNGTYSDEIFKEQNKLIEDQIANIQITKDDSLLEKYNLEAVVRFIKEKFANLGTTYQMSNLSQLRILLCSIFPSGMVWSYPGYYNTQISPIYQSIRMFDNTKISLSTAEGSRTPDSLAENQMS